MSDISAKYDTKKGTERTDVIRRGPGGRERGMERLVMAWTVSEEGRDGCPVDYWKEEKADVSGIARWETEGTARRIYENIVSS